MNGIDYITKIEDSAPIVAENPIAAAEDKLFGNGSKKSVDLFAQENSTQQLQATTPAPRQREAAPTTPPV